MEKIKYDKPIPVRLNEALWRRIMRQASLCGMKPSSWIRTKIIEILEKEGHENS